jgi:hypothetical protein
MALLSDLVNNASLSAQSTEMMNCDLKVVSEKGIAGNNGNVYVSRYKH